MSRSRLLNANCYWLKKLGQEVVIRGDLQRKYKYIYPFFAMWPFYWFIFQALKDKKMKCLSLRNNYFFCAKDWRWWPGACRAWPLSPTRSRARPSTLWTTSLWGQTYRYGRTANRLQICLFSDHFCFCIALVIIEYSRSIHNCCHFFTSMCPAVCCYDESQLIWDNCIKPFVTEIYAQTYTKYSYVKNLTLIWSNLYSLV